MPRYIKPFAPTPVQQIANSRDPKFRLEGAEIALWDTFASEPIQIAGTDADLYIRDLSQTQADPLYAEPIANAFVGPYSLRVHIEWPEFTPDASEDGLRALWPSSAWIPRKFLEQQGIRAPREGDILRFWKLPYFDKRADGNQGTPGAGFFFDMIKVNDDGHLFDSAVFVGFRCDLKRRSNFSPEMQFLPPKVPTEPCND